MSTLDELKPTQRERVIDLVRAAGVDVSDWANFKGGERRASVNPKYCYEWSFIQPHKVVVLNLWHELMQKRNGKIFQNHHFRESAQIYSGILYKSVWKKRVLSMDRAVRYAFENRLPVRVIVCDGQMRDRDDPEAEASKVQLRKLDPVPWWVTSYNNKNGDCTVTRGGSGSGFVDQFSLPMDSGEPSRRQVTSTIFDRDPGVRLRTLERANGKCEWCEEHGFRMADGRVYLETHHVVSLSEGGVDVDANVVALCPNHHREAHHGARKREMSTKLLARLRKKLAD